MPTTDELRQIANTNFPDNTNGEISARDTRDALRFIADVIDQYTAGTITADELATQLQPLITSINQQGQTLQGKADQTALDGVDNRLTDQIVRIDQSLAPRTVGRGESFNWAIMDGVVIGGFAPDGTLLARFPTSLARTQQVADAVAVETQARTAAINDLSESVATVSETVVQIERQFEPVILGRGDGMPIAVMDGVVVVALDKFGFLRAHFPPDLGEAAATALIEARLGPVTVGRGESMPIAVMDGVVVAGFDPDGTFRANFPPEVINPTDPGGGGGATPSSPDVVGDSIDAWNVWESKGTVFFTTGQIWGTAPREFVKRGVGQPWANGPSRMRLRLVYGDALANASTDRTADRFAHVATLNDLAGQFGWNGETPGPDATDLTRAGNGYSAVAADQWLARKAGAMPWLGARSEGVNGATLAQLRTGQPMLNLRRALDQFVNVVEPYGRTAQVDAVSILHGVADDSASYGSDLLQLTEDVIAQTGAVKVHVMQPSGTWARGDYASSLGTLEALRNKGQLPLVVVSPLYWASIRNGSFGTPTPTAMTMLAELDAIAGLSSVEWLAPLAYEASRVGTTINVDFETMPGFTLIPSVAGLTYSGGTLSAPTIVSNPVSGLMTRLQMTSSAAAGGTLAYRLAPTGNNPAQLANFGSGLRDDWSEPSVTGQTLYRHALHFKFEVA